MKFRIAFILLLYFTLQCLAKTSQKLVLDNISDLKDFKKLLRTKTNILVCFYYSYKESRNVIKVIKEVADNIKGEGTLVLVNCSGDAKKMCKKLKIPNESYFLKHYKDGVFNKDYDRKITVNSMTNFMRDPTGDLPWEEDSSSPDIFHIPDLNSLARLLKKESKPILIMFYAPWCSFCKSMKPDYSDAASELKDSCVLAAMDVNRPENSAVRTQYNITGFPTLLYFLNGKVKYTYEGENKKSAIISFMQNPIQRTVKLKEPEWSDVDSEVVHLTTASFEPVIKEEASVLVMFYAPWCGHCKKMKPVYELAATKMKNEEIPGMLAAIDVTREQSIASRYSVKGYPTIMYFSYGEQKFDVNVREASKIIEFMKEPKEPPPPPPPEKPWSDEETDVVHLTEENFKLFLRKKKHVLLIFYAPWCGHCKRTKPEFTNAATRFKNDPKVQFAAVDCTSQPALCNANEVKGYPTLKYFSYYSKSSKMYTGGRTTEDFVQFMNNPEKPATVPLTNDRWAFDSSVLHLNDNNFKSTIEQHEVVLVMFYVPWCGHCKNMKPNYVMAAKQLELEGFSKCLAMVNCELNPGVSEEYEISGFPTVKLFKNGKFIKDYTGQRTAEDIKKFILQHVKRSKEEL